MTLDADAMRASLPSELAVTDADRLVVAVLARDNAELRCASDLRVLAAWLRVLDDERFRASVAFVARHRAEHKRGAPIGPVLYARYGQGDGERALSAALLRRDFAARLREVNGLAVVAKAGGVPVCMVELLRFALWQESGAVGARRGRWSRRAAVGVSPTPEQARRADINLRWRAEFDGAVARARTHAAQDVEA